MFACFGLKSKHKRLAPAPLSKGDYAAPVNGYAFTRINSVGRIPLLHKDPLVGTPHGTPLPQRNSFRIIKRRPESESHDKNPVKVARPSVINGHVRSAITSQPTVSLSEQRKKQEAEISAKNAELLVAREEAQRAHTGVEALTVLIHHLTTNYDALSTPRLRAEVESLCSQLTNVRLCLDESTASIRRLEEEATERCQAHIEEVLLLQDKSVHEIETLQEEHQQDVEKINQKHQIELRHLSEDRENSRLSSNTEHSQELERVDIEWRQQLDIQHERHLQALEQLNTCHTQQLRESETRWNSRDKFLQGENATLKKERDSLMEQRRNLEQTLLSDKDHKLQAVRKVCSGLQSEVDSLKTVVDMRNTELHRLRDQVADRERLCDELEAARERVRSHQAKTEDLLAQMKTKAEIERQRESKHLQLSDAFTRETTANRILARCNEELKWKLQQREFPLSSSLTPSSPDAGNRSGNARLSDGGLRCGGEPQHFFSPAQRVSLPGTPFPDCRQMKSKRWSHSHSQLSQQSNSGYSFDSPPSSPCVKAVIEKSNSVSFILDLNDTFYEEDLGDISISPVRKPQNSAGPRRSGLNGHRFLEKSTSSSYILGTPTHHHRDIKDKFASSLNGYRRNNNKSLNNNHKTSTPNGHSKNKSDLKQTVTAENGTEPSKSSENTGCGPCPTRSHSTSESSEGELEPISPTSLSWTVPVHKQPTKRRLAVETNESAQFPPDHQTPQFLQNADEDEYEEAENGSLPCILAQTPTTSMSLSDSDASQCGSRVELSTQTDESSEDEGTHLVTGMNEDLWVPQEGAGEAMIPQEGTDPDQGLKSAAYSVVSSDSEEPQQQSWSEDADCDLTSSSEMQDLIL